MVCRLFAGGRWIRTTGSAGRRDCPFRDHLDWPTAPSLPRETTYLARETWSSSPVCSCGESGELPIVAECIYIVVGDLVDNCTAPAVTPSTGRAVAGPLVRIHSAPAVSQTNFRIAPLTRWHFANGRAAGTGSPERTDAQRSTARAREKRQQPRAVR